MPGLAEAATLTADRGCYAPGDPVGLTGSGYTPNGPVAITVEGRQLGTAQADPAGAIAVDLSAPDIDGTQRTDDFVATDQTDLSLTATAGVKLTSLNVTAKPKNGKPGRKQRIKARGFIGGKALWAHIQRGRKKRNVKVGELKGPCGTLNVKKRLFSPSAQFGLYRVQFDAKRRYSQQTVPQVYFFVTVFQVFKPASASTATALSRDSAPAGAW